MRRALLTSGGLLLAALLAVVVLALTSQPARSREAAAAIQQLAGLPSGYSAAGRYVGPMTKPAAVLSNGIPRVNYAGIGPQENPVTVAQYGLWAFSSGHDRIALRAADWLVTHQKPDGRWLYHFDFGEPGWKLRAPWASAMAQGQAMSLLERVYRRTHKSGYRRAALSALRPLERRVRDGGLTDCFFGECRLPFYEEYPTATPIYVLNGFMFTLLGLHDLATVAPRSAAGTMYQAGLRTLLVALPRYDISGMRIASYDLGQTTVRKAGKPFVPPMSYQAVHVYLLRALDSITPEPEFRRYAARWETGLHRIAD